MDNSTSLLHRLNKGHILIYMKTGVTKIMQSASKIIFLALMMMGVVAYGAWSEPGVLPGILPPSQTPEDYQLNHILADPQHKNYQVQQAFSFSLGSQQEIYDPGVVSGGGGSSSNALSPFLALVSGNFKYFTGASAGYVFPEALYVEDMKIVPGNIKAITREKIITNTVTALVPGFIRVDKTSVPGSSCSVLPGATNPCDVVYLEGGTNPSLPIGGIENDMVNILVEDPVVVNSSPSFSLNPATTTRFGVEKNGKFASLRMGQLLVDRALVGGNVPSLNTPISLSNPSNFIGNFVSLPDNSKFFVQPGVPKPEVLAGTTSFGSGTTATTKFSNIGYGDYCYIQNPRTGVICPDGFFLSKYDGVKEAICRSFNPSPNPQAVTVIDDFRGRPQTTDVNNHVTRALSACKSSPPQWVCSDGIDNDGDGQTDYPGDTGCQDIYDMSEYNTPLPPPPTASTYVTVQLKGPYAGKSCNYNGSNYLSAGILDTNGTDWMTFVDSPTVSAVNSPTGGQNTIFDGVVDNLQYWGASPVVPQKNDQIVSKAHYGTSDAVIGNYAKKGPVVPGWYFIKVPQGAGLYKVRLGWGNSIIDVKSCGTL